MPDLGLAENVFHAAAFPGQQINLFAPDSLELKDKLKTILAKSYSSENLSFLEDMHQLNSEKDLLPEEMKAELESIRKKYIDLDAETPLNIHQSTLTKIRKNPDGGLAVYKDAIKEVFDLINTNVTKDRAALSEAEEKVINKKFDKVAEELSLGYNAITKLAVTKSGGLNILSPQSNESRFEACRNICKKAQSNLATLVKNPGQLDIEDREIKFREIANKAIKGLAEKFQQMQQYENKNPDKNKLSQHIEKMIDITSAADAKLKQDKIVTHRIVSKTKTSESSSNTNSSLRPPERSTSRSSASLSSIKEFESTLPREYKQSSRAENKIEKEETKKTEDSDSVIHIQPRRR